MNSDNLFKLYQTQSQHTCVFCEVFPQLIIRTTENFSLLFDPFALSPGHLLISSHEHYGCLGEVPKSLQEECTSLRTDAMEILKKTFNSSITRYEHGRAGHCMLQNPSSLSCHHYHEHLIPSNLSLHSELEKKFKWISFIEEKNVCTLFEKYEEYLLVEESNGDKRFYITNNKEIEPHFLRTLSAKLLGFPQRKNWENYLSCKLMQEGQKTIKSSLKRVYS